MNELQFDLTTSDGQMECFAAHPDGAGPFPAVILYMDVVGIREELRGFARRIAEQGYFCLLPDMFYREGRLRFDVSAGASEFEKMFAAGRTLNIGRVMSDTRAMLGYLDGNPVVSGPVGCFGYCMSGQYAVAAAGTFPDRFAAAASLHGVGLVTDRDDSPHRLAGKIRGEIYLGFAAEDPYVEANVIPDLSKALDENGVAYAVVTHPGTHHGYSFPERPSYAREAAERDWSAMFGMFERRLKQ